MLDEFLHATLTFPKPVIAAMNGHAIAGGCILAAACDHRIMTEGNGRIGIPELAVGVPFPALPLQIMAARVPDGHLRDLVFTGRTVQIDEAKTMGLIDEKCPAGMLLDRATEVAQKLAAIPAGAFALTKEAFYSPILERARQLSDLNARVTEAWLQQHTYDTIRAYLDKTIQEIDLFPHPVADRQAKLAPVGASGIAGAPQTIDRRLEHHVFLAWLRGNIKEQRAAPAARPRRSAPNPPTPARGPGSRRRRDDRSSHEFQHAAFDRNHRQRLLHRPAAAHRVSARIGLDVIWLNKTVTVDTNSTVVHARAVEDRQMHQRRSHWRERQSGSRRQSPAVETTHAPPAALAAGTSTSTEKPEHKHPERHHDRDRLRRHAKDRRHGKADQHAAQHAERQAIAARTSREQRHRQNHAPPQHRDAADETKLRDDVPEPALRVVGREGVRCSADG